MNKKLGRIYVIVVSVIVIALIALSAVVKSYLKSDRLKALIIPKVEELTGRKADVSRIDVSLFRGITVRDISLMEQDGKQDFIKAREFVLEYRLLPLLRKKLVIKKVDLISPSIRLVKERDGRFNFSDILDRRKQGNRDMSSNQEEKGLPLTVETDRISVRNARVTFEDEGAGVPAMDLLSDLDLKLSAGGRAGPDLTGKVKIKEMTIKGEGGEIKGNGTVSIGAGAIEFNITAVSGKDSVLISGDIKDYKAKPVARADISAPELDVERLVAFSGGGNGKEAPPVKRSLFSQRNKGKVDEDKKTDGGKSAGLTASGEVKIGTARYKGYILKNLLAAYRYSEGIVSINPISAGIAGEKGITLQGAVKGELGASTAVRESPANSLKSSLTGKFSVDMNKCEMKESKIGGAIALFTGIKELASPRFDTARFLFTIGNEKIALNGNMNSGLMTLNPSGTVGFDTRMDVVADLRVAPAVSGGLVRGNFMRYAKDEKGWTVLPLKITGTTEKPSVGVNPAAMGRQLQRGVTQEMQKGLFKGIFGR